MSTTHTPTETKSEMPWETLIREHQSQVWQYLRYLGADGSEADDLTQESFLALMRSSFEVRTDVATRAYLRKVARNQLLMLRRRQGKELDTIQLEVAENVWAKSIAERGDRGVDAFLDALDECRQKLEGRARQAIDLFYQEGLGREELATRLEMKPQGVKTLLRRTRTLLRECVERGISK